MAHDVFISYSAKDKPVADAMSAALEGHKIRCWVAPRDILPSAHWVGSIMDAFSGSRVSILVFSANSNSTKPWSVTPRTRAS